MDLHCLVKTSKRTKTPAKRRKKMKTECNRNTFKPNEISSAIVCKRVPPYL